MPTYVFIADNEAGIPAGYCQRVTQSTQMTRNFKDRDGVVKGPDVYAFRLIQKAGVPLLPNVVYRPHLISRDAPQGDMLISVQTAQPSLAQVQVNAPYAEMQGNRGQDMIPMPIPGDKTRWAPAGDLEPLPDAALPSSGGDGLYGEMDGLAGTYSDTLSNGQEVFRPQDMRIPQSLPNQQRVGQ